MLFDTTKYGDPNGKLAREACEAMKTLGYNVKVLNLTDIKDSDTYSPEYLQV